MKKIFSLILVLTVFMTGVVTLVACKGNEGGNENEGGSEGEGGNDVAKVDYTLSLKDQNGDGIEGIDVTFRVGPKTQYTATTDANGKAAISIEETELPIRATIPAQLPEGYSAAVTYVDFASGSLSAEIEVVKNVAHTVFVTDAEGNALSGANVQVCVDGVCQVARDTDADGKAVFYVSPDAEEAYAQFNSAPEGYAIPDTVKIYFTDGKTEATFVLEAE